MTAKTAIEKIKKAYDSQTVGQERILFDYDKIMILHGIVAGFESVARINADEINDYIDEKARLFANIND